MLRLLTARTGCSWGIRPQLLSSIGLEACATLAMGKRRPVEAAAEDGEAPSTPVAKPASKKRGKQGLEPSVDPTDRLLQDKSARLLKTLQGLRCTPWQHVFCTVQLHAQVFRQEHQETVQRGPSKPRVNLLAHAAKGGRFQLLVHAGMYPDPPIPLDHGSPFQLLVAVVLSAQVEPVHAAVSPGCTLLQSLQDGFCP